MAQKKTTPVVKKKTPTTKKKIEVLFPVKELLKGKKIRRTVWPEGQHVFLGTKALEASNFRAVKEEDKEKEIMMYSEGRTPAIYRKPSHDLISTDWEVVK